MAAVLTVIGGTAGFAAGLIAIVFFSYSALSALAIWAGTGLAVTAAGLVRALLPQPTPDYPPPDYPPPDYPPPDYPPPGYPPPGYPPPDHPLREPA